MGSPDGSVDRRTIAIVDGVCARPHQPPPLARRGIACPKVEGEQLLRHDRPPPLRLPSPWPD